MGAADTNANIPDFAASIYRVGNFSVGTVRCPGQFTTLNELVISQLLADYKVLKRLTVFYLLLAALTAGSAIYQLAILLGELWQNGISIDTITRNSLGVLCSAVFSSAVFYSARCLAHRRRRFFILLVAGVIALLPFGIILAIYASLVLHRPTIKELFSYNHSDHVPTM